MNRVFRQKDADLALQAQGYDGVLLQEEGFKVVVVFQPNQVKSATENSGAFDSANPDIWA